MREEERRGKREVKIYKNDKRFIFDRIPYSKDQCFRTINQSKFGKDLYRKKEVQKKENKKGTQREKRTMCKVQRQKERN